MDQHSTQEARHHTTTKQTTDTEPSNTPTLKDTVTLDVTTLETSQDITPKSLTANQHKALLQMQKMDPFCKCISKRLLNGKAPKHETNLFTHVKGLLDKHIMDAN